jgi:hypothetical protein
MQTHTQLDDGLLVTDTYVLTEAGADAVAGNAEAEANARGVVTCHRGR